MTDDQFEAQITLALDRSDYPHAQQLAAHHSDPDGCSTWIDTHRVERRRCGYIARIRVLWREERDAGAHNPPDELGTDLDALTLSELEQLGRTVRERVTAARRDHMVSPGSHGQTDHSSPPPPQPDPYADLPTLPDGWRWIGRYRASHDERGRTGTYTDPRRLLRALRQRMPKREKREGPPPALAQGELFA